MHRLLRVSVSLFWAATVAMLSSTIVLGIADGATNASDTPSAYGLPSTCPHTDAPGAHGSYAPDQTYHNSRLSEWNEPGHDWFRDRLLRWGSTEVAKLRAEAVNRTLVHEQRIHGDGPYEHVGGGYVSTLPYTGVDVDNGFEQSLQGYDEFEFQMYYPDRIVAGTTYYGDVQWNATWSNAYLVQFWSESEYADNAFHPLFYDEIGYMKKCQAVM